MATEIGDAAQETSLIDSFPFSPSRTDNIVDNLKGLASYLMMPFWSAQASFQYCLLPFHPGEYGQETSKAYEYAKRFFIVPLALVAMTVTLPFALLGFALTGLARIYESANYRYFSGDAAEVTPEKPKFFHLNICGFYGGLPYALGGTTPANERLDEYVKAIEKVDPDLVFLCECNRMLTAPLYYKLKEDYAHFFVDIGLNAWGMENSLFVASRMPIVTAPQYVPFDIKLEGKQKYLKRGFFSVETEDKWYIYTHLHSGNEEYDRGMRQQQLDIIQTFIDEKTGDKPCVLLGDLNINRLDKPNTGYQKMIKHGYKDYFADQHPDAITGSDKLNYHIKGIEEEVPPEVIDYILIQDKGKPISLQIDLYETYDYERLDLSLSDHNGLIGVG